MKRYKIAVLPGDGIGPEIIRETVKVVDAVAGKFNYDIEYQYGDIGAIAIDRHSNPYPEKTHEICMESDAVLFGAIGDLKYDNDPSARIRPEQGLLDMRKNLGLYANIRPISTFSAMITRSPLKPEIIKNTDFVCIRELTGGLYFGQPRGRSEDGNTAFDTCIYTREEVKRICKLAFEFAMSRKKKLTIVDKANVLATSRLWREVAKEMESDFPEVITEYMFVDNAAMKIVQCPTEFDVIVTENMFGDILTDEASVITGSLGMLPSISIGSHTTLYEPIHGSYPQAAGKNIANPMATILSAALMFEHTFKNQEAGSLIRKATSESIEMNVTTEDICLGKKASSTSEVGDFITEVISK